MEVTLRGGAPLAEASDALIVPVSAGEQGADFSGLVAEIDSALGGELGRLASEAGFTGKPGSASLIPTFGALTPRRVVLVGTGDPNKFDLDAIRRAWAAGAVAARDKGAKSITSVLPPSREGLEATDSLVAASEGAQLATYRFTAYYGQARASDPTPPTLVSLTFVGELEGGTQALDRAEAVVSATNLARDLVNEPASVLNPPELANRAAALAQAHDLEFRQYGPSELAEMGAGAILAVGGGSANPPRLIHLTYRPKVATAETREIGLVGKAITFDTGGYSIKPYEGMLDMKIDMAGGAAVLGTMSALAAVGCPHIVHGVICSAENMISGTAFRPGDILTALNGVTIEILSTDAEGRLVLADGLVYTARQGAQELIDLATLTGAAVVALGNQTTALFASDDDLAQRLLRAAEKAGESTWRMPLSEHMESQIKGDIGDIKNTGGRPGGAITAALFLQHFREGLPWAHLDIAGPASAGRVRGYTPKGGTGVMVRTLLTYLSA